MYFLDSAHVLHVAKTGNDSNSGKAGQYPVNLANDAKLTIGSAISAAASGDTIILWPGDYAENVSFGSKALTMIGTSRNKSKIVPATGTGVLLADDSVLLNLAVEALQTSSGGKGVSCFNMSNIVIDRCDIYGGYDGLYGYGVKGLFLQRSRIRGKYDGGNFAGAERVVAKDCIFAGLGTYSPNVDCRAVYGLGIASVYQNCVFEAQRDDTTTYGIGAMFLGTGQQATLANCVLKVTGGSGVTGSAFGVMVNGTGSIVNLANCIIATDCPNASSGPYDLWQANGKIIVSNSMYETFNGTIIHGGPKANMAMKLLANKSIQTKSTGVIQYYDDDGATILLTLTPTEDATKITLTPS